VGESQSSACQTGFTEGGYIDFLFYVDAFKVSVSSSNASMGSVYIGEAGVTTKTCSSDGTETATLTAVPEAGYEFVSWTLNGEVVSTDAVYTTTAVTETREYVANFQFKPVDPREVKVATNDSSKGYATIVSPATSESSIVTGEMVTVKAVAANEDNTFVNWTVAGVVVSTDATYTYSGAEAVTLVGIYAVFSLVATSLLLSPLENKPLIGMNNTTINSSKRVHTHQRLFFGFCFLSSCF
jgi:hypothetical protein